MALRGEAPTYIVKLLHANSPNWILRYTDSGLLGILHLSENHRGLCLPNLSAKAMDLSLSLSLSDTDTNIWSNMIAIFKSPILSIFVFFETSKQRSCRVPPGGKKYSKTAILTGLKGVSPLSFPNFHSVAVIMLTPITNTGQQYCPVINGFDSSSYCVLIMFRKILLNL